MIKDYNGNKQTAKHRAQDLIMNGVQAAFYKDLMACDGLTEKQQTEVFNQMDKQMGRIEKLFGYDIGSWPRN